MDYLIRFSQSYETFRIPELEALAKLENVDLKVVDYSAESPFCTIHLPSEDCARRLIQRSILVQSIHELWGHGATLEELHACVQTTSKHLWPGYMTCSFKLSVDSFQNSRSAAAKVVLIESFAYLGFEGPIRMRAPDHEFTLFEQWAWNAAPLGLPLPERCFFGRRIPGAVSARDTLPRRLDLKKRRYISTTSMDAELSLVTANIALARPGALVYDPFVGTGSFPLACAQFGALAFGSDIDGRSMRGDGAAKSLRGNFAQYGLLGGLGGVFAADLTNSPLRRRPLAETSADGMQGRLFDAIICDPPYGVREGLYVLGVKDPARTPWVIEKGRKMYKQADFVPPRKPYGFLAMLDDILDFAAQTLVDDGRVAFWMPTANDENLEIPVPTHPYFETVAVCVQVFQKWSRRLITYRRIPNRDVDQEALRRRQAAAEAAQHADAGRTADELNPFRRGYFTGFETET